MHKLWYRRSTSFSGLIPKEQLYTSELPLIIKQKTHYCNHTEPANPWPRWQSPAPWSAAFRTLTNQVRGNIIHQLTLLSTGLLQIVTLKMVFTNSQNRLSSRKNKIEDWQEQEPIHNGESGEMVKLGWCGHVGNIA